jgi:hypothetical protein
LPIFPKKDKGSKDQSKTKTAILSTKSNSIAGNTFVKGVEPRHLLRREATLKPSKYATNAFN